MTTHPTLVLINPAAGGGRCAQRVAGALEALRAGGEALEVVHTTGPGHATALAAEEMAAGRRSFIAAGGDGTAWEVVSGLMGGGGSVGGGGGSSNEGGGESVSADAPTLGFLPAGTGNSYLRDFGAGSLDACVAALREGVQRPSDVIRIDTGAAPLWSLNLVSIGFVADICREANDRYKALGQASYVLGLLHTLARLHTTRWRLREDGGPWREPDATFLSFNNSRCTGGAMQMAPAARIDDGLLDVIEVGPFRRLPLLAAFPSIFRGTHIHHPHISARQCRRVDFDVDGPVDLMIDGEVIRSPLSAMTCIPAALRVRLPGGTP